MKRNNIQIKPLRKKDLKKAREFSIVGMHTDWYTDRKSEIFLYSQYFLYWELVKATRIVAAYDGDDLVGLVTAQIYDEKTAFRGIWPRIYIKIAEFLMGMFFGDGASSYGEANDAMLEDYKKMYQPEGEINFWVTDPDRIGEGIGTILLEELEKQLSGKEVFLYTDSGCTYQFYDKRGFERAGTRDIVITIHEKETPLKCFLYRKKIGKGN